MPILDLQQRIRELGRIRIGDTQPTQSGKTRPSKLSKFRITSASRPLLEKVAELYGGEVRDWTPQNSQLQQFEVYTEADRLPVIVPPNSVSQWYEVWSGGGCQRRCDGVREVLKDQPCPCGPDPADRTCKPTTRVNVMLREVEGIGVWRLESHGFNAAVELPQAAEFLARAGGYVEGFLTLAERSVVRDGKTSRFMVPALDIGITAGQLLGGGSAAGQLGPAQPAALDVPPQRSALPAGGGAQAQAPAEKTEMNEAELDMLLQQVGGVATLDDLTALSRQVMATYEIDRQGPVPAAFRQRAQELQQPSPAEQFEAHASRSSAAGAARTEQRMAADDDGDRVWPQVMMAVPEEWSTSQVEADFEAFAGVPAEQGTGQQMRDYIAALPERTKAAS